MPKFKIGDKVRLKSNLAMAEAHDPQEGHVKGEVIEVTDEGYTVVLYDETLISKKGLTDDDLELDE